MKHTIILSAVALSAVASALGQNVDADSLKTKDFDSAAVQAAIHNSRYVYFKNGETPTAEQRDSVESLMEIFYANQFRNFQDPHAPYLMFLSNEGNFAMGVAGVIRMRGWYDWGGSIQANGFCPYLINIPEVPTQEKRLGATPAGCALVYTMLGRSERFGNYIGYLEAGFNGYNNVDFKLKKAYITVGDWTAGYATSTFCDPSSVPPVIDGAGPNGKSDKTNVLVRYMHNFKKGFTLAVSGEIPGSKIQNSDPNTAPCADFVPDVAAFAQYSWGGGASHVRLSGLFRVLSYRSLTEQHNYNIGGWGVQLSTKITPHPQVAVYGQFNYGKGHASYLNDLSIDRFDLMADADNTGRMYAPESFGATLGVKYYFLHNLFAGVVLGENRIMPRHNPRDDSYKYGLYGAVNVFWNITLRFQVGGEYLLGKRMNFNGDHKSANRVDAFFQLSF